MHPLSLLPEFVNGDGDLKSLARANHLSEQNIIDEVRTTLGMTPDELYLAYREQADVEARDCMDINDGFIWRPQADLETYSAHHNSSESRSYHAAVAKFQHTDETFTLTIYPERGHKEYSGSRVKFKLSDYKPVQSNEGVLEYEIPFKLDDYKKNRTYEFLLKITDKRILPTDYDDVEVRFFKPDGVSPLYGFDHIATMSLSTLVTCTFFTPYPRQVYTGSLKREHVGEPKPLSNPINKETTMSPHTYVELTNDILRESAKRLAETDDPIIGIIKETGVDRNHFYKGFREMFKTTPSGYRAAQQEKGTIDANSTPPIKTPFDEAVEKIQQHNPDISASRVIYAVRTLIHRLQDPRQPLLYESDHYDTSSIPRALFDEAFLAYTNKTPVEVSTEAVQRRAYRPQSQFYQQPMGYQQPHQRSISQPYPTFGGFTQQQLSMEPMVSPEKERENALAELSRLTQTSYYQIENLMEAAKVQISRYGEFNVNPMAQIALSLNLPLARFYLMFVAYCQMTPLEYHRMCQQEKAEETPRGIEPEPEPEVESQPKEHLKVALNRHLGSSPITKPTDTIAVMFMVNGQYSFVAFVSSDDNDDIGKMSPMELIKSPYRDEFNAKVVERLKLYFHGNLDIAYLEPSPNGYFEHTSWQDRLVAGR